MVSSLLHKVCKICACTSIALSCMCLMCFYIAMYRCLIDSMHMARALNNAYAYAIEEIHIAWMQVQNQSLHSSKKLYKVQLYLVKLELVLF